MPTTPDTDFPPPAPTPTTRRAFPIPTLALTGALLALAVLPRIHTNPALLITFIVVAAALGAWHAVIARLASRSAIPRPAITLVRPLPTHLVQACVQTALYAYWGWFFTEIYAQIPLIIAQAIFLCVFDALLAWSRGRAWRPGLGLLPIIFSTNFFLWFNDNLFIFQFAMVASAALIKEFITWERDGKRTHIFNPSAIALSIASLALILTGTTDHTHAQFLADSFDRVPHMYLVVFALGLVVQGLFGVTLMTMATVLALWGLNLIYTEATGVYQFISTNISAAIFLGAHLLVTDPATSPRTHLGRFCFGLLYGAGIFVLFDWLGSMRIPELYAKLLIVPVLNVAVLAFDTLARTRPLSWINTPWEAALPAKRMNLVHMGAWVAAFWTMHATGFLGSPHPGNSIEFWKRAVIEDKPHAERKLTILLLVEADNGNGAAANELGLICLEGNEIIEPSRANAARYFAQACALRDADGCANVAGQFLFHNEWRSVEDLTLALDLLEADCATGTPDHPHSCFLAAYAWERGPIESDAQIAGRPRIDLDRAAALYASAHQSLMATRGLARTLIAGADPRPYHPRDIATILARACEAGDTESCWYIAYFYQQGIDHPRHPIPRNPGNARAILQHACSLGHGQSCDAVAQDPLPPFEPARPMATPGWSTAYPIEGSADNPALTPPAPPGHPGASGP
ncbi:MAG: hypothetical protein ACTS3F_02055 [Phycisphaerales bacterium]